MEQTVLIPAINRDCVTPEGNILVEIGHHRSLNGMTCPFPFKIESEFWPPHRINEYEKFCAEQYNQAKNYGKETETLDESAKI